MSAKISCLHICELWALFTSDDSLWALKSRHAVTYWYELVVLKYLDLTHTQTYAIVFIQSHILDIRVKKLVLENLCIYTYAHSAVNLQTRHKVSTE